MKVFKLRVMMLVIALMTGFLGGCRTAGPIPATPDNTTNTALPTGGSAQTDAEAVTSSTAATENVTKATTTTRITVATTATTASRGKLSDRKTSDVGFGYCGMDTDYMELDTTALEYMETDHTNTFMIPGGTEDIRYGLEKCKKYNSKGWIVAQHAINSGGRLREGWRSWVDSAIQTAKDSGAYDAMLGFYLDEPLLNGTPREDVYELTKYVHDKYGKRFFICFSVAGVAPEVWSDPNCQPVLTPETSAYITDIGFDMYWDYDEHKDRYDRILKLMKQRCNKEARIWYFAWAYTQASTSSETLKKLNDPCTRHLNAMYEYLKQEEHPGGLMVFIYNGAPLNFIGIKQAGNAEWKGLRQECERIGREICTGKTKS